MSIIDENTLKYLFRSSRKGFVKPFIPENIQNLIFELGIVFIKNENDRAETFLKALQDLRLKSSTVLRYFVHLKKYLFPNTTYNIDTRVFDNAVTHQTRGIMDEEFDKLMEYVMEKCTKYLQPRGLDKCAKVDSVYAIATGYYTCLRASEILKLTASNLCDLQKGSLVIPLQCKTKNQWNVIYHDKFKHFIKQNLTPVYADKTKLYAKYGIDSLLFDISYRLLHYNIQSYFSTSNDGKQPPKGFGMHTIRYHIATILAVDQDSPELARQLLGHQCSKTTKRYLKANNEKRRKMINSIFVNPYLNDGSERNMYHDIINI